jgi:hypothetical protein
MGMTASSESAEPPFNRRTLFAGILASLLAAAAFFLLSTFAPDFRLGAKSGATPLSKSGIGFAGLAELMELTGEPARMARSDEDIDSPAMLIVTLSPGSDAAALDHLLEHRQSLTTLFILPKWQTIPSPTHQGWEMKLGRLPPAEIDRLLDRIAKPSLGTGESKADTVVIVGHTVTIPPQLQWIESPSPVIAAGPGKGVLVAARDEAHYVLADPDFLNNAALKDPEKAAAALDLINSLRSSDEPVLFDLTLHGAGRTHDLARLLVEPPFLALTLTLLVAAALAFLHGLVRFGPPQPEQRAIPFGKQGLVDTTTTLLGRAGHLGGLGGHYSALMRGRAATLLGAPQSLNGEALDEWLDSRDKSEPGAFSRRLRAAAGAKGEYDMQQAAQQLHGWIARRLGEYR